MKNYNYLPQVKKFIGKQYVPTIQIRLLTKRIFNRQGDPYSQNHIQKIVRGTESNDAVENEIMFLINKGQRNLEKKQKLQKQLTEVAKQFDAPNGTN